jgi:hypothetical protein
MAKTDRRSGARPPRPRCRICERAIHVPKGWSTGPAVRRHYWRKHPEIMRGKGTRA